MNLYYLKTLTIDKQNKMLRFLPKVFKFFYGLNQTKLEQKFTLRKISDHNSSAYDDFEDIVGSKI